mmetsp:Transcript_24356/g.64035  ORF Transcript_24356/g.64035 Transcript_24356/m.64035 type:complete len:224 (+) Transcript_24356:747-1418(+)
MRSPTESITCVPAAEIAEPAARVTPSTGCKKRSGTEMTLKLADTELPVFAANQCRVHTASNPRSCSRVRKCTFKSALDAARSRSQAISVKSSGSPSLRSATSLAAAKTSGTSDGSGLVPSSSQCSHSAASPARFAFHARQTWHPKEGPVSSKVTSTSSAALSRPARNQKISGMNLLSSRIHSHSFFLSTLQTPSQFTGPPAWNTTLMSVALGGSSFSALYQLF